MLPILVQDHRGHRAIRARPALLGHDARQYMMLANKGVQVSAEGAWLAVPPAPRARAKEARLACAASPACKPLLPVLRWDSSWPGRPTPPSSGPRGAARAAG